MTNPDTADLVARLDRIQLLTERLAKVKDDAIEQLDLAARIYSEIEAAKLALKRRKTCSRRELSATMSGDLSNCRWHQTCNSTPTDRSQPVSGVSESYKHPA